MFSLTCSIIIVTLICCVICYGSNYTELIYSTPVSQKLVVPYYPCVTEGSPTATAPQIYSDNGEIIDVTPAEVIDNRVTKVNHILAQANIQFDNPIGSIQLIPDPDTTYGTPGNMTIEDFTRFEWKTSISNCKLAFKDKLPEGTPMGLVFINIKQFIHKLGDVDRDLLGVSSCKKDTSGFCAVPYSATIFVKDIQYTGEGFDLGSNNDPQDQAAAHEFGHPGGLNHRSDDPETRVCTEPNALMCAEQQENGAGGTVSNTVLSEEEINTLRINFANVPGAYFDSDIRPFERATEYSFIDDDDKIQAILPFQNISSVILTTAKDGTMTVETELNNLVMGNSTSFWTLIDVDGDKSTGSNNGTLYEIGIPNTNISGIELAIFGNSTVLNNNSTATNNSTQAWFIDPTGQNITLANHDLVEQNKATMELEFDIMDNTNNQTITKEVQKYDIISHKIKDYEQMMKSTSPISIYTLAIGNNTILDEMSGQVNGLNYKRSSN
jgi:hypothetical protein